MAEQSTRDVVNKARSVGDPSPTDVSAPNTNHSTAAGEEKSTRALTDNLDTLTNASENSQRVAASHTGPQINGTDPTDDATGVENVSLH